jgi:hypothetical protein
MVSTDEGTIRTSRGIARFKFPYLARQLSVFSAPANYRVLKITCFSSKVVLQTMKHTMIYPSSGLSSEVVVLRSVV